MFGSGPYPVLGLAACADSDGGIEKCDGRGSLRWRQGDWDGRIALRTTGGRLGTAERSVRKSGFTQIQIRIQIQIRPGSRQIRQIRARSGTFYPRG